MMDYNGQLRRGYYKGVTAFPVQAGFFGVRPKIVGPLGASNIFGVAMPLFGGKFVRK
jgi:hypothetical protein